MQINTDGSPVGKGDIVFGVHRGEFNVVGIHVHNDVFFAFRKPADRVTVACSVKYMLAISKAVTGELDRIGIQHDERYGARTFKDRHKCAGLKSVNGARGARRKAYGRAG